MKRLLVLQLPTIVACAAFSTAAHAWGANVHRLVAQLAQGIFHATADTVPLRWRTAFPRHGGHRGRPQGRRDQPHSSLQTAVLDTTVQPKPFAHPTDSRLLNRTSEQLVAAAQKAGVALRQSYARVGKSS